MKALEGVRVLDMTHVQSGPTCTQLLAWFGADVIKVERPGRGDATRGQLRDIPDVDSLYFTMLNHNKRSVTLNTKSESGKALFTRLLESCDVLAENFAPGALDRMGFSWERIQQINPRIIYASNKGFEDWGGVLGDEVMAAALIDRLVHHCHIVNIRGNSYRMKDHQNLLQSGSDRRRKRAAA